MNKQKLLLNGERPDPFIKLQEHIKCPVCLDVFAKPKLLACSHALCSKCIDHLPVDIDEGRYIVKCPTCRKLTTLPQKSATNLPPAFHINTLIELHNAAQGIAVSTEPKVFDEPKCLKHDRLLEMFCEDCLELVCTKCFHRHHHDHTGDYVTDILAKHQQDIIYHLMTVKRKVRAVLDNFNNRLCVQENEIIQNGETIKNEIDILASEILWKQYSNMHACPTKVE